MHQNSKNTGKVSAVSSIERTGLELVRRRKPRGKPASIRDYAKINFEAWTREPDMRPTELLPTEDTLRNCGISARLAYAAMLQTKEQLIGMFDHIEIEHIDNMLASYADSAERLKAITSILEAAYLRVLIAGCAHEIAKGKARALAKRRRTLAKRRQK